MRRTSRLLQLVAHRGNSFEFPENTMPALRSALELGVPFLEIDVQLSRDGVPVVIHDRDLTRTAGVPGSVLDTNVEELLRADVCEPLRFGERYRGTHMPRLADAIGLLENRPQITLFVEIRRESLARFGHELVLGKVLETLRPFRSQCVIVSFDLPVVYHARRSGGYAIGWVLPAYDQHTRLKFEALQPEYLFCDVDRLAASGVLWRGPWRWVVYDVAAFDAALRLAERGVDLIETMRVRALTDGLRAHAAGAG